MLKPMTVESYLLLRLIIFMSKRGPATKSPRPLPEPQPKLPPADRARNFLSSIEEQLVSELENHKLSISATPKPYLMEQQQLEAETAKLRRLHEKKHGIQMRLGEIEQVEKKYEEEINMKLLMKSRNHHARPKSQLSQEDALKLKQLKREHISFERELQEKTRQFEENEQSKKAELVELKRQQMAETNEKKKKAIQKRLEEMEEKRKFRQLKFEEEKKQLARVMAQKKLHEELERSFERQEQEKRRAKAEEREKWMRDRSVDFATLKEHEDHYEQVMREKKDELSKKRLEVSRLHRSQVHPSHKSKFHAILMEEETRAKALEMNKKSLNKQISVRMRDYAETVKQNHAPRIKTREDEQSVEKEKKTLARATLDVDQIKRVGMRNLEANKSLASRKKKQIFDESSLTEHKPRYFDYLRETRQTREQKSEGNTSRFSIDFRTDVKAVKKIVNSDGCSEAEKMQKIRRIAEKIDSNPQTLHSDGMLAKIAAKIELLEALK